MAVALVPRAGPPGAPQISLRGVTKTFGGSGGHYTAVSGLSLDVRPGEFLCLCGPSGCGKSTLLNLMAGLERPDAGEVLLDGSPVQGPGPDRAVMFQEPALFPWRDVFGNIAYPLEQAGWRKERIAERVNALLRAVHLARFAHARVHQLSGGMRQRVSLARSLAADPEVVLMDEPFAALDAQTRDVLLAELQRLWMDTGKTIVFVTHNVREAVVLGTRVALMATRPGRILRILDADLPRPRSFEDPDVAQLAGRVKQLLAGEVERVLREELGDDYSAPKGRLDSPGPGPLGSGL